MKRYQTKPVSLTVFRLNGPEDQQGAIDYGAQHGWNVALEDRAIISLVTVSIFKKGVSMDLLHVDPRHQALAYDETPDQPHPWFVINMTDLWSIYREIPSS